MKKAIICLICLIIGFSFRFAHEDLPAPWNQMYLWFFILPGLCILFWPRIWLILSMCAFTIISIFFTESYFPLILRMSYKLFLFIMIFCLAAFLKKKDANSPNSTKA
jgi:membrane-associated HD superfamily phosphohydrolase